MKLIRNISNVKPQHKNCVATIGSFDGLHLGHQYVFQQLKQKARALNLPATLITFEPHPKEFFAKDKVPARLTRLREKILLLKKMEIDQVLIIRFNKAFAELSAEEFIQKIIVNGLHVKYLIVGDDFHFGKNRLGNFQLLQQMGQAYNFAVASIDTQLADNQRISSSLIRKALAEGDLLLAEKLLGRPYSMCGKVIHGDKLGRVLGYPTANMQLHRQVSPLQGIFAVKIYGIDSKPLLGVASIGKRPTVDGTQTLLEVYIFDFDRDIYGQYLQVEFLHKLRDEEKYTSLELLTDQIEKDVKAARDILLKI